MLPVEGSRTASVPVATTAAAATGQLSIERVSIEAIVQLKRSSDLLNSSARKAGLDTPLSSNPQQLECSVNRRYIVRKDGGGSYWLFERKGLGAGGIKASPDSRDVYQDIVYALHIFPATDSRGRATGAYVLLPADFTLADIALLFWAETGDDSRHATQTQRALGGVQWAFEAVAVELRAKESS